MTKNFLDRANDVLINVYPFWPIQIERGDGVYLVDTDGKKYLDFGSGIAVNALGYHYPGYDETIKNQLDKIHMGLCYIASEDRIKAAETLVEKSDFDQVFFCSTGAEAVEGCLKTARKWATETKGKDAFEIIYVAESFHGRTMGALSVNGQEDLREGFEPLLPGTHQAVFNDLESVQSKISKNTAAIIVEPVMGEGGIIPADQEFLEGLRELCDAHDIALIFDEVQCGIGRIGTLFAYQYYGVVPDLVAWAKGLGGGYPVGAFMGRKKFTAHITPGSHGSTYGGAPIACEVVNFMIKEISRPEMLDNVKQVGAYLREELKKVGHNTGAFSNVRGLGLMIAADYNRGDVKDFIKAALKNGLIVLKCGDNALRLLPPLIITREHVDEAIQKLRKTIEDLDDKKAH